MSGGDESEGCEGGRSIGKVYAGSGFWTAAGGKNCRLSKGERGVKACPWGKERFYYAPILCCGKRSHWSGVAMAFCGDLSKDSQDICGSVTAFGGVPRVSFYPEPASILWDVQKILSGAVWENCKSGEGWQMDCGRGHVGGAGHQYGKRRVFDPAASVWEKILPRGLWSGLQGFVAARYLWIYRSPATDFKRFWRPLSGYTEDILVL